MRVLIIGGTQFLGRHFVEAALHRGDEVTLFNRGRTNPGLYPDVEKLQGDRTTDLSPLAGRSWDAVVDTSGYVPRVVRASAELLAPRAGHYTFISSLSVYDDFASPVDESSPVSTLPDPATEEVSGGTYGGLKALCEAAVEEAMPGRALAVRAGLIVGPYDPLNRFPYWLKRIPQGGEVLAPGSPANPVQLIHARDIADWALQCAENATAGVFNVTGRPLPLGELLELVAQGTGATAEFAWVPDEFLVRKQLPPLDGVPLWVPPEYGYFFRVDVSKAQTAGLGYRPLSDTIRDTAAWLAGEGRDHAPRERNGIRSGLTREEEAALLAEWRAEQRLSES